MANELERSRRIVFDRADENMINVENAKLLRKYEIDMEIRGLSSATIYNYRRDLLQFLTYLKIHGFNQIVTSVQEDDIEEFIYYCKEAGNNTERIKRRLSAISAFFIFLRRKKMIDKNPMEFISRPKRGLPVVVQTYLTLDDVTKIRKFLKNKKNIQMELYVELSLATMARVNAISNLRYSLCDMENMMFNNVLEKEQRLVDLYFNRRVKRLLEKWREIRRSKGIESDYIFINGLGEPLSVSTLQEWTKKIGLSTIGVALHPHDWRHSGATLLKNAGMNLEDISALLNHKSTDVTNQFYIREDKTKRAEEFRRFSF